MASQSSVIPPDENRGPGVLAVSWVETIIAIGFVGARMYCRGILLRNLGRDDWTMLLAFVLALATTVCVTLEVSYGVGRHINYLSPEQLSEANKWLWLRPAFSTFSACFGKISIAFLLMRLMNRNKIQEIILWFIIVSLMLVNIGAIIVTYAQCSPVWQLWSGPRPNPNCWNPHIQQDAGYIQGSYSAFTDFILAIFPYFIIWKLQLDRKVKLGLLGLLSLGVFATAASIVKTVQLKNLTSKDFTWDQSDLVYWVITENYVIIIAACIPTLRPLFNKASISNQMPPSSSPGQGSPGRYAAYGPAKSSEARSSPSPDPSIDQIPLREKSIMINIEQRHMDV